MFSVVNVCTLFYNQKPSYYLQMTSSYNMKSCPTSNDLLANAKKFAGDFIHDFVMDK